MFYDAKYKFTPRKCEGNCQELFSYPGSGKYYSHLAFLRSPPFPWSVMNNSGPTQCFASILFVWYKHAWELSSSFKLDVHTCCGRCGKCESVRKVDIDGNWSRLNVLLQAWKLAKFTKSYLKFMLYMSNLQYEVYSQPGVLEVNDEK